MRDLVQLRDHLFHALVLAPLVACGTPTPTPVTTPTTTTTAPPIKPPAPAPDAAVTEVGPGPDFNMPSCPTGKWCGPAAAVKPLATTDSTTNLACATRLYDNDDKGNQKKVPADWPMESVEMTLDEPATKAKRAAKDATTCCYDWVQPCPGGRALVVDGAIVRAPVDRIPPAGDLASALADAWLADATAEHASIASFARTMLELMAVAAPRELLDGVAAAIVDELDHTERCFALAARYAGRTFEPGPLPAAPPRAADLARLACDTFVEGCVGETVAVLAATRALAACRDAEVARALEAIVADETRHAALAWRTLAWTIDRGGATVLAAVRAIAVPPSARDDHHDARLAAHGRLDRAAANRAEHDAWREVILPTLAALSDRSCSTAS